jgi:hypothetical protein
MEILIEQAFAHIDVVGDHVKSGHYDLFDPSGGLILPSLWETIIQPDWTVTMHMWPSPKVVEGPTQMHPLTPPLPSKPAAPAVPMAPSVVFEPRSRTTRRERVLVEPRSQTSRRETDSITDFMSTDEDSDDINRKSTYQEMLTESFMKHGQQFEETWEAVMARSRVKAQKTILEMWLGESEAELRKLNPSPSRDQRIRGLDQKASVTSEDISEDKTNSGDVPGRENRESKELPRPAYGHSSGQEQPLSPATSLFRASSLCESCQSPFLLTKSDQQTPTINKMGSFMSLAGEIEHISQQHVPPEKILEQRIGMLEDLIKNQEVDRQARLDKAKSVENEQRLSCLEKAMVQPGVQTLLLTPAMSETSPMSTTNSMPSRPALSRSGNGTTSYNSRSSFRKRLFGRSTSSSAAAA